MSDMNLSLIIRLVDQFTAPARRLRDGVAGVMKDLREGFADAIAEGFSAENMDKAIANAESQLGRARGRLLGAFGMATALAAPVLNLGRFETELVSFGNTAGIFGEDLEAIGAELRRIGPDVNKSASEMLVALEYLVGKGLSPEAGLAALRAVGMTATATSSDIRDMAASGFAVLDNLKVPAEALQAAFDAMAQSGKSGGFELKAMAQHFPQLTASARALGLEGVDAVAELGAALQVAKKGAGSESEAANNMNNFLSKLASPETVKRFSEAGVSLEAEFNKAAERGVSVFEHMLGLIDELTEGNQFRMGQLFGDQQVLAFLRPMMANLDEFRAIREAALGSEGINEADFTRTLDPLDARMKQVAVQLDNLLTSGAALLDIAKELATMAGDLLARVNAFAEANPELTRTLVLGAAALMSFAIAGRLAAFAVWAIRLPALQLLNLFLRFDTAGRNVAIGWRLLRGAGGAVAMVFGLIAKVAAAVVASLGAVSAPVWAAAAVLYAAGLALWKYWDRVSAFVTGLAQGLGELLGPALGVVRDAIGGLLAGLADLVGFDRARIEGFQAAIAEGFAAAFNVGWLLEAAREQLAGFWDWIGQLFTRETLGEDEKEELRAVGRQIVLDIWEGIKAAFAAALEWFSTLPEQIAAAIGSIDISGLIRWPDPPEWLSWLWGGGGDDPPHPAGDVPPAGGADWWNPFSWGEPQLEQTIHAEVIDKRPPEVNVQVTAPITVTGVADPRAAGQAAANQLATAIGQASASALHDGMQ